MKFLLSSIKVICAMTLLSVLSSCAMPVLNYKEPKGGLVHFDFDPNNLNCVQLTEQVIRVQGIITDLADKLKEQADRGTASTSIGLTTNNPLRGTNFLGFKSEAVDPAVEEYQKTLSKLEEMQILLIANCSKQILSRNNKGYTPD